MNVRQVLALGLVGLGLSSCNLLGNAVSGGPAFSGDVINTPPAASNYKLALIRFSTFGGSDSEQSQTAGFTTTIQIAGGNGVYSGFLVPTLDIGGDAQRYFKVAVYEDKTNDDRYDLTATNSDGQKDVLLADSINGKAPGGNRFLVYAAQDGEWAAGKPLKKGWNLVVDVERNTTTDIALGRSDDQVTQGLGGITIAY
jgi:hypothetical protein